MIIHKWGREGWRGGGGDRVMVINANLNNISVIPQRAVLFIGEGTGVPGEEKTTDLPRH